MKDLLRKLFSPIIWGNLLAMVVAAVLLVFLVWQGMRLYTHHGEKIEVPNVKGMLLEDAKFNLEKVDLEAEALEVGHLIRSSLTRRAVGVVVVEVTGRKGSSFLILLVTPMRKTVLTIQVALRLSCPRAELTSVEVLNLKPVTTTSNAT